MTEKLKLLYNDKGDIVGIQEDNEVIGKTIFYAPHKANIQSVSPSRFDALVVQCETKQIHDETQMELPFDYVNYLFNIHERVCCVNESEYQEGKALIKKENMGYVTEINASYVRVALDDGSHKNFGLGGISLLAGTRLLPIQEALKMDVNREHKPTSLFGVGDRVKCEGRKEWGEGVVHKVANFIHVNFAKDSSFGARSFKLDGTRSTGCEKIRLVKVSGIKSPEHAGMLKKNGKPIANIKKSFSFDENEIVDITEPCINFEPGDIVRDTTVTDRSDTGIVVSVWRESGPGVVRVDVDVEGRIIIYEGSNHINFLEKIETKFEVGDKVYAKGAAWGDGVVTAINEIKRFIEVEFETSFCRQFWLNGKYKFIRHIQLHKLPLGYQPEFEINDFVSRVTDPDGVVGKVVDYYLDGDKRLYDVQWVRGELAELGCDPEDLVKAKEPDKKISHHPSSDTYLGTSFEIEPKAVVDELNEKEIIGYIPPTNPHVDGDPVGENFYYEVSQHPEKDNQQEEKLKLSIMDITRKFCR